MLLLQVHSHIVGGHKKEKKKIIKKPFPLVSKTQSGLSAGFRLDGNYVNGICHISLSNYGTQWRRIGPPWREVKDVFSLHNKLVGSFIPLKQRYIAYIFHHNICLINKLGDV